MRNARWLVVWGFMGTGVSRDETRARQRSCSHGPPGRSCSATRRSGGAGIGDPGLPRWRAACHRASRVCRFGVTARGRGRRPDDLQIEDVVGRTGAPGRSAQVERWPPSRVPRSMLDWPPSRAPGQPAEGRMGAGRARPSLVVREGGLPERAPRPAGRTAGWGRRRVGHARGHGPPPARCGVLSGPPSRRARSRPDRTPNGAALARPDQRWHSDWGPPSRAPGQMVQAEWAAGARRKPAFEDVHDECRCGPRSRGTQSSLRNSE